jgi:hypothetical protein
MASLRNLVVQTMLLQFINVNGISAPPASDGEHGRNRLSELKSHLGDDCSYGELKLVLASLRNN